MNGLDPHEVGARLRALGRASADDIRVEGRDVVLSVGFACELAARLDMLELERERLTEATVEFLHTSQRIQRRLSSLRPR